MNADEYRAGDITVPESIPTQVVDLAEYRHILSSIVPGAYIERMPYGSGVRLSVGVSTVHNFSRMPSDTAAVEEMKALAEELRLNGIRAMGLHPILAGYEKQERALQEMVAGLTVKVASRDSQIGALADELSALKERLIEMGGGEV